MITLAHHNPHPNDLRAPPRGLTLRPLRLVNLRHPLPPFLSRRIRRPHRPSPPRNVPQLGLPR